MSINTEYSDADLLAFTKKIIFKTNSIQNQITGNKGSKVIFPYTQNQVFILNLDGYKDLAKITRILNIHI